MTQPNFDEGGFCVPVSCFDRKFLIEFCMTSYVYKTEKVLKKHSREKSFDFVFKGHIYVS